MVLIWRTVPGQTSSAIRGQKYVQLLLAIVLAVVYFIFAPSACYFYSYVPAQDLISDIEIAPPLTNDAASKKLPFCPTIPSNLDKVLDVKAVLEADAWRHVDYGDILPGGCWRPTECVSRHRVAIVVSYRNRETQLKIFLQHMHSFLRPQMLDYRIIVVEQTSDLEFNRGQLFNIGFKEGLNLYPFHCFIFHDVDLLPENTLNLYTCAKSPRHMSVSVNTFRYSLIYRNLFGGAISFSGGQFRTVNGFSNLFFGWGGEDDDISRRVRYHGLDINRWDPRLSRYYMLSHVKEPPSENRFHILDHGEERYATDGLINLDYHLVKFEELPTYTRVLVRLNKPKSNTERAP